MTDERQGGQYEPAGVRAPVVLATAAGFALIVAVALAVVWLLFGLADVERREGARLAAPPMAFPPPRLQAEPAADLRRVRQRAAARLRGYAWVDRERGLVKIPIERAMALIAARGAAGYAPVAADGAATGRTSPAQEGGGP